MWQKLSRSYPPSLELIALFLLTLTIYLSISSYPSLPDRIPTHFNFQGVPDGWGNRNEIFVLPVLSACLYILLTGITVLLAVVKDPRKFINLPAKRKAALNESQIEELRIFLNRSLFALKVLTHGLLICTLYRTIEVALNRGSSLGASWFFFVLAIIILAGYMLWKSFRITAIPKP